MLDVGYLTNKRTWNLPAFSFAGQSYELSGALYRDILRAMSAGGWLATAVLRLMDYFKVNSKKRALRRVHTHVVSLFLSLVTVNCELLTP